MMRFPTERAEQEPPCELIELLEQASVEIDGIHVPYGFRYALRQELRYRSVERVRDQLYEYVADCKSINLLLQKWDNVHFYDPSYMDRLAELLDRRKRRRREYE